MIPQGNLTWWPGPAGPFGPRASCYAWPWSRSGKHRRSHAGTFVCGECASWRPPPRFPSCACACTARSRWPCVGSSSSGTSARTFCQGKWRSKRTTKRNHDLILAHSPLCVHRITHLSVDLNHGLAMTRIDLVATEWAQTNPKRERTRQLVSGNENMTGNTYFMVADLFHLQINKTVLLATRYTHADTVLTVYQGK